MVSKPSISRMKFCPISSSISGSTGWHWTGETTDRYAKTDGGVSEEDEDDNSDCRSLKRGVVGRAQECGMRKLWKRSSRISLLRSCLSGCHKTVPENRTAAVIGSNWERNVVRMWEAVPFRGALRDIAKDGCEGDYSRIGKLMNEQLLTYPRVQFPVRALTVIWVIYLRSLLKWNFACWGGTFIPSPPKREHSSTFWLCWTSAIFFPLLYIYFIHFF